MWVIANNCNFKQLVKLLMNIVQIFILKYHTIYAVWPTKLHEYINYQFHECMVQKAQLSIAFKLINLYICDMSSDLYSNNLWLAQLLHPKSSCHQIIKIHYACNVSLVWILIPYMLPANSKFHMIYSLFIKLNSNLVNCSACNKIQCMVSLIYVFTLLGF